MRLLKSWQLDNLKLIYGTMNNQWFNFKDLDGEPVNGMQMGTFFGGGF